MTPKKLLITKSASKYLTDNKWYDILVIGTRYKEIYTVIDDFDHKIIVDVSEYITDIDYFNKEMKEIINEKS